MGMTNLKAVLLVEDDPDHAHLIRELLQENGHLVNEIIWIRDGQQAIDYLYGKGIYEGQKNHVPELILLDLKLPERDGFEVLRIVKQDEVLKKIPVVMLTTSRNAEDVKKALELGANDYVIKPITWEDFERKVRELGKYWALVSDTALGVKQDEFYRTDT